MPVIAYVPDLMFSTRIAGAAKQAGVALKMCGTAETLAGAAADASLAIIDLNAPNAMAAIEQLKSQPACPPLLGFVSHVDTATIEAARAAGCDEVVARSAFFPRLASRLAEKP